MGGANDYKVDVEDEVVRGALVIHAGEVTWPQSPVLHRAAKPTQQQPVMPQTNQVEASKSSHSVSLQSDKVVETSKDSKDSGSLLWLLLVGLARVLVLLHLLRSCLTSLCLSQPALWLASHWNVKLLYTPLMSVTNAISGIIIIGGMLQISGH